MRLNRRYFFLIRSAVCLLVIWQMAMDFRYTMLPWSCQPIDHVVFIKTHKTAGSSIQNMLMRYGTTRDLRFVVPKVGHYFNLTKKFNKDMAMPLMPGDEYDILAHHCRFNYESISSIMPKDSKYFTILRETAAVFESSYKYYSLNRAYNLTLEEFVGVEWTPDGHDIRNTRPYHGRNQMSFDLGLDIDDFDDHDVIAEFAKSLERMFDLVLITDRLPESVILMKHILCWSTDDVVFFQHNARDEQYKIKITPKLTEGIRRWNRADEYIYNYFNAILDRKVMEFGRQRMDNELEELRVATDRWYDACVKGLGTNIELDEPYKVRSPFVRGFKLKSNAGKVCQKLTKPEIKFTMEIQNYMLEQYPT